MPANVPVPIRRMDTPITLLSPNPNTIAASEAFGIDLTALMMK